MNASTLSPNTKKSESHASKNAYKRSSSRSFASGPRDLGFTMHVNANRLHSDAQGDRGFIYNHVVEACSNLSSEDMDLACRLTSQFVQRNAFARSKNSKGIVNRFFVLFRHYTRVCKKLIPANHLSGNPISIDKHGDSDSGTFPVRI